MISGNDMIGLLLSGGESRRMGTDKGELVYRDRSHRRYTYELMKAVCPQTFVSCREDQADKLDEDQQYIPDSLDFKGPLNGILSAHSRFPDKALLVLAVDLPYVAEDVLRKLAEGRDPGKMATAFAGYKGGPEPLIAIWEPQALRAAAKYAEEGGRCPRKFLLQNEIALIQPEDEMTVFNANFPEDYERAKKRISKNG